MITRVLPCCSKSRYPCYRVPTLINNRDFRNFEGRTNYLYQFVDTMFTYFLVGCTTSLYNIWNMHASTALPNNMRINSNDEGDSPLVIRIWRLSPIPIMIVRCVHLHYHGTMKACQEKPIALILQRKQYISSEIPVFKYEWFYFSNM